MPESPCADCGKPALHTEDDKRPLCAECVERQAWNFVIWDILEGRVDGEKVLEGMKKQREDE